MNKYVWPQVGDLLLVYDDHLIDRGIDIVEEVWMMRKGLKRPFGRPVYSHVAVYVGANKVIEALGRGLTESDVEKYRGIADVWSRDNLRMKDRSKIAGKARGMLRAGYSYSRWDVVILFFRLVFGLRFPWKSKTSLVCSVFGFDCWLADDIRVAPQRNCWPEEIPVYQQLGYKGRFGK